MAAVGQVQHVVVEAVGFVPHACVARAQMVDGVGDVEEVLPELARDVLVGRVLAREFQGDGHQVEAVHRHPARAVGLLDEAAAGQRLAAVEDADVVEAQEAALENVLALGVLAVHPPGEIQQQLVKDALQKLAVGLAAALGLDLVHAPRGPGMHRRIDVAEIPLISRYLPVGVHVPFAHHQQELVLGESESTSASGEAVESRGPKRRTTDIPTCPAWR